MKYNAEYFYPRKKIDYLMEPEQLKRGKEFHKRVQSDWVKTNLDGELNLEYTINLWPSTLKVTHIKMGRLDMFLDELSDFVSIVEIKSTNWDKIKTKNITKLLGSHRRQIWKYIMKYIEVDKIHVCPGIIYPNAPKSQKLKEYIEEYLNIYGLQVIWYFD